MIVVRLRNLTLLTLLSLCVTSVVAQKIDGYFVSRAGAGCTTYFLTPQELFVNGEGGRLKHDVTIKRDGVSDSTRVNFSYQMAKATAIDSIRFESAAISIGGAVERIYIEPDANKGWTHRYSYVLSMSEFAPLYNVDAPATMTLYSDGQPIVYESRKGEWQKYAPIGAKIMSMIRIN